MNEPPIFSTTKPERAAALIIELGKRYGAAETFSGISDGAEVYGYYFRSPDRAKFYSVSIREENGKKKILTRIFRHAQTRAFQKPNGTWQPVVTLESGRVHVSAISYATLREALDHKADLDAERYNMSPAEYRKFYPIPTR